MVSRGGELLAFEDLSAESTSRRLYLSAFKRYVAPST